MKHQEAPVLTEHKKGWRVARCFQGASSVELLWNSGTQLANLLDTNKNVSLEVRDHNREPFYCPPWLETLSCLNPEHAMCTVTLLWHQGNKSRFMVIHKARFSHKAKRAVTSKAGQRRTASAGRTRYSWTFSIIASASEVSLSLRKKFHLMVDYLTLYRIWGKVTHQLFLKGRGLVRGGKRDTLRQTCILFIWCILAIGAVCNITPYSALSANSHMSA